MNIRLFRAGLVRATVGRSDYASPYLAPILTRPLELVTVGAARWHIFGLCCGKKHTEVAAIKTTDFRRARLVAARVLVRAVG